MRGHDAPPDQRKATVLRAAQAAKGPRRTAQDPLDVGAHPALGWQRLSEDGEGSFHHRLGHEREHLLSGLLAGLLDEADRLAERGPDRRGPLARGGRGGAGELVQDAGRDPEPTAAIVDSQSVAGTGIASRTTAHSASDMSEGYLGSRSGWSPAFPNR